MSQPWPHTSDSPTEDQAENLSGKIITFYSYKGGTGRSMMVANVAWALASNGRKVLVIDWDLEAPGLQRYFYPFLFDKDLSSSAGLMDFVDDYKNKALTPPPTDDAEPSDWYAKYADIREYAVSLQRTFPGKGRLDFVPAGRQDDNYALLVNQFNWQDFYEQLNGNKFLEMAAQIMRQHYHYILIDSRTGVSDTSGICTVKMPDALVACFTLNYQGINGTAAVADYVYKLRGSALDNKASENKESKAETSTHGRPNFDIFPVPMRLEDAQTGKLERRRKYARDRKFAKYPVYLYKGNREDYWASVPVDYHTFYAYEEILAAFGEEQKSVSSLLASVEHLTAYLTDGQVDQPIPLPQPDRDAILKEFAGDTYEPLAADDNPNLAVQNAFTNLSPNQRHEAQRIILRLVRLAGVNDAEHTRQFANLKDFDEASQSIVKALRNFQVLTIQPDKNTGEEQVQLHPNLVLQTWAQLQDWIKQDETFLRWRQNLRDQVQKWDNSRRGEDQLLPLTGLDVAKAYLRDRSNDLFLIEREFIEASVQYQNREQQQREREEHERQVREQFERASRGPADSEREQSSRGLGNLLDRFKTARSPVGGQLRSDSPNVKAAHDILRGQILEPRELLTLAKKLKEERQFGLARRLLARARLEPSLASDPRLRLQIFQQSALCTYKDPDLQADARLDHALEILRQAEDLDTTTNQETLGLTGAIYKQKWGLDNQKQQLERSLNYYLRGYAQGVTNDQGYNGINAAFILDVLAQQEEEEAKNAMMVSEVAAQRRRQSKQIRAEIVMQVSPLVDQPGTDWLQGKWWFYSTVAEAYFGMGEYDKAIEWLRRGSEDAVKTLSPIAAWEYESAARQLTSLAQLQDSGTKGAGVTGSLAEEKPLAALRTFFGKQEVQSSYVGKVGLALSGGGFRAALFHIGVLARLAELDVLRRVEVLSCVSGGSIIGTHYYLELRKLLQAKPDAEITRQDYLQIVARLRKDFLDGVQRNVRMRVYAEFITNVMTILRRNYSGTLRVGELYEREIFARVDDGGESGPRWLNGLTICPSGRDGKPEEDFNLKLDNWRRGAKVPNLILNATTLNTGHNWQFTASWMGEPPAGISSDIDGNDYLRRLYYDGEDTPKPHRQVRLGHAVAASACVPGLFEPLALEALYPERVVRLVDGGVSDNQGISSLLEQDCNVILVSDGSGQMESQGDPSNSIVGVPLRSNSILQARVREAQYHELSARKRASLLRSFMFVHLKDDLDVDPIDWIGCLDPYDASDDSRPAYRRGRLTRYGIAKELQAQLAGVRTDLDSFSDLEAFALMTSAYRMTEYEFKYSKSVEGFSEPAEQYPWDFLIVEQWMRGSGKGYEYLRRLLSVSGARVFKIWRLSTALKIVAWLGGLLFLSLASVGGYRLLNHEVIQVVRLNTIWFAVVSLAVLVLFIYLLGKALSIKHWGAALQKFATGCFMTLVGWIFVRIHLIYFDRLFLRYGQVERLRRLLERSGSSK